MKRANIMITAFLVLVVITIAFIVHQYQYSKRKDIKIPILLYHDFVSTAPDANPDLDQDKFNYINTPESFEENIKTFLENGYTIISLKDLNEADMGKKELPAKPLIITFDDGYYSNYEYIYPILKKYNVKASIFVVTDNVGKEMDGIKYLGWNECLEMQNSGLVEIFSHSKRHIFYNKVLVKEIREDVLESYKIIEENLGKKDFKAFAYPYGAYTKETVKTLRNTGIDMQLYDIGMNGFKDFNKHYVKRINVPCEMTGKEIIQEIL